MKTWLFIMFFLAAATLCATDALTDRALHSVVLLYSQNDSGTLRMHCTATAFEKTKTGYHFATAAHCIGDDDVPNGRVAKADDLMLFVTFDESNGKTFYHATAAEVGYQSAGDDFLVLNVETDKDWPIVPLGDESKLDISKERQARILNVASPGGLGLQIFRGLITKMKLDRPILGDGINWRDNMFVDIVSGPGSSGSAIISVHQQAIVGFLLGVVEGKHIVAAPVSRFKAFRSAIAAGLYRFAR